MPIVASIASPQGYAACNRTSSPRPPAMTTRSCQSAPRDSFRHRLATCRDILLHRDGAIGGDLTRSAGGVAFANRRKPVSTSSKRETASHMQAIQQAARRRRWEGQVHGHREAYDATRRDRSSTTESPLQRAEEDRGTGRSTTQIAPDEDEIVLHSKSRLLGFLDTSRPIRGLHLRNLGVQQEIFRAVLTTSVRRVERDRDAPATSRYLVTQVTRTPAGHRHSRRQAASRCAPSDGYCGRSHGRGVRGTISTLRHAAGT
jgi:hypothetical protein